MIRISIIRWLGLATLWTESDAITYYEKAISNGFSEDRSGAMLGLGSTYRCLDEYTMRLGNSNEWDIPFKAV